MEGDGVGLQHTERHRHNRCISPEDTTAASLSRLGMDFNTYMYMYKDTIHVQLQIFARRKFLPILPPVLIVGKSFIG